MSIPDPVRNHLERVGAPFEIVDHPVRSSSMRKAEAAHVSGEHLAKGMVLKDAAGYVLAVLPATHHVRIGTVQERLGRPLEPAPELDLGVLFPDCDIGAVPVLGAAYDLETIVDESLRGHEEIWFEAGDHRELIRVSGRDFESLLAPARFLDFSEHRP